MDTKRMSEKTCAYCDRSFGTNETCKNCGAPYVAPKNSWSGLHAMGTYIVAFLDEGLKMGTTVRFYRGDTYCGDLFVSHRWRVQHAEKHGWGVDFSDELVALFDSGVRELLYEPEPFVEGVIR